MGRKSLKAKERKMKRKEENAKLHAKQEIVDAANQLEDPLSLLPVFKKFDRNGLNLTISCKRVADLDKNTVDWVFDLTKLNMQKLYEDSEWGWNDKQKLEEMTEEKAWYLIASDAEDKPTACVHFRFDIDCDDEVLYCYEIQLIKEVRRKGLGKFLMQILELLAHKTHMIKVMVTVFKQNQAAYDFFSKSLKYEVDETSPEDSMVEAMFEDGSYTYQILSKPTISRKAKTSALTTNQNGHAMPVSS